MQFNIGTNVHNFFSLKNERSLGMVLASCNDRKYEVVD